MSKVRLNIHRGQAIAVAGPLADRAAYLAAQKARGHVISEIRAAGRVNTGRMIQGMQVRKIASSKDIGRYEVFSSAPYTMFQNAGTRGHGPRTAKVMAFTPKGSNQVVFAKWVKGIVGARFMEKGLARVRVQDFLT